MHMLMQFGKDWQVRVASPRPKGGMLSDPVKKLKAAHLAVIGQNGGGEMYTNTYSNSSSLDSTVIVSAH